MADTLEHLQSLDDTMQTIARLLTEAVQATEQAEAVIGQIPHGTSPNLVAALPHLKQALTTARGGHETLAREIESARQEIERQVAEGTYAPDSI